MFVVTHRKIFYIISSIFIVVSLAATFFYGLNFGIDFKGGSVLEARYSTNVPTNEELTNEIKPLNLGDFSVRSTGESGYIVKLKTLSEPERVSLVNTIQKNGAEVIRFDSIGPVLGKELQAKAIWSLVLVILAIVIFITLAFRGVSKPVASWKYGLVAIVALVHDVIVPTGIFAILGHFQGTEIDTLFITALLVILGFSVHDTIVVFDRVRENLKYANNKKPFEEVVGESISQTFTRSINTTLTVLLSLVALYVFGPESTHNFALALLIGIAAGTYSSVFLGSPLLVTIEKMQKGK